MSSKFNHLVSKWHSDRGLNIIEDATEDGHDYRRMFVKAPKGLVCAGYYCHKCGHFVDILGQDADYSAFCGDCLVRKPVWAKTILPEAIVAENILAADYKNYKVSLL